MKYLILAATIFAMSGLAQADIEQGFVGPFQGRDIIFTDLAGKLRHDGLLHRPQADDTGDGLDFILSQGGYARAGVGHLAVESDSHPTWLGYIRVEDVAASVARAVNEGGAVLLAPGPALLDGNLAVVSDPMGAPIALIHWAFDDAEAAR